MTTTRQQRLDQIAEHKTQYAANAEEIGRLGKQIDTINAQLRRLSGEIRRRKDRNLDVTALAAEQSAGHTKVDQLTKRLAGIEQTNRDMNKLIHKLEKQVDAPRTVGKSELDQANAAVDAAQAEVDRIESLIAAQQTKIKPAPVTPDELATQRNKLGADLAEGTIDEKAYQKAADAVIRAELDLKQVNRFNGEIEGSIVELRERLQAALNVLGEAKDTLYEVQGDVILHEADKAAQDYLRKADEMEKSYRRLLGFNPILVSRGMTPVSNTRTDQLQIPAFRQIRFEDRVVHSGMLHRGQPIDANDCIADAEALLAKAGL